MDGLAVFLHRTQSVSCDAQISRRGTSICAGFRSRIVAPASTFMGRSRSSRPRFATEELSPEDLRASRRERYRNLSLAERDAQDRRIAAATARRWRKKGLP